LKTPSVLINNGKVDSGMGNDGKFGVLDPPSPIATEGSCHYRRSHTYQYWKVGKSFDDKKNKTSVRKTADLLDADYGARAS
jgi:hypothetical protein